MEIIWDTHEGTEEVSEKLLEYIGSLGKIPDTVKITVKPMRDTRTLRQLRMYFAWCKQIAEFENERNGYGWTKDEAHQYLKSEFFVDLGEFEEALRYLMDGMIGVQQFIYIALGIVDRSTTTESDTKEFTEKLDLIKKHYAKVGCYLMYPDEPPITLYDNESLHTNGSSEE